MAPQHVISLGPCLQFIFPFFTFLDLGRIIHMLFTKSSQLATILLGGACTPPLPSHRFTQMYQMQLLNYFCHFLCLCLLLVAFMSESPISRYPNNYFLISFGLFFLPDRASPIVVLFVGCTVPPSRRWFSLNLFIFNFFHMYDKCLTRSCWRLS